MCSSVKQIKYKNRIQEVLAVILYKQINECHIDNNSLLNQIFNLNWRLCCSGLRCYITARGPWVRIQQLSFCVQFACSLCTSVDSLWLLRLPPSQNTWCDPKLVIGVSLSLKLSRVNSASCWMTANLGFSPPQPWLVQQEPPWVKESLCHWNLSREVNLEKCSVGEHVEGPLTLAAARFLCRCTSGSRNRVKSFDFC